MTMMGRINYIDRNAPAPTTWYVDPPAGTPVNSVVIEAHDMAIDDLRCAESFEYRLAVFPDLAPRTGVH
ncbi:hypothetical protein Sphch_3590 [Sphingobium chlorophenolicum L-1]|uniref:Uncharacterized protein n=1 Tax=Sphingobium chlorophenolicum L-1 TaxID=690566 RepID=F6F0W4_SPHCR|nr:hypothetical protein [Sphingobium chlorophenolicum]AEG51180.1 hypothetical protein Sphch_3590 [Sphingobium chlorophenolicum L-1]